MRLRRRLRELEDRVAELEAREPVRWEPPPRPEPLSEPLDWDRLMGRISDPAAAVPCQDDDEDDAWRTTSGGIYL